MQGNAYTTIDEIVTAASQELRDAEFSHGIQKPFYVSATQRALERMNYATSFFKKIATFDVPENLILDLPSDLTAKDQIYLFNGNTCDIASSTILFIKPNMWHGGGSGYVANNKGRNRDAMQYSLSWSETPPNYLYFAGERMGQLFLSPSCLQFDKIMIPYTGIGVDCFGKDFQIPLWAREAITDFVIHRVALAMERDDPQHMNRVIARKEAELKGPRGSWMSAINLYKRSDKKQRYDTDAYTYRLGHLQ